MHKQFNRNIMFNIPFYQLRKSREMTQKEFGDLLGVSDHTIMQIENCRMSGKLDFWRKVQDEFDIPDDKMWAYINGICTLDNML